MSKEGELKLIDLKVSVHCCDGCKRKVKKALQSIEGVVRTEIYKTQPKVTVEVRMVEPQTLIRKLAKIGKTAELWTNGSESGKPKDENSKEKQRECSNEVSSTDKSANKDGKSAQKKEKSVHKSSEGCEKSRKDENSGNVNTEKGGEKGEKQVINGGASSSNYPPEVTKSITRTEDCSIKPGIVHLGNVEAYYPYPYTVVPPPPPHVPQVYYMTTPYSAPPVYIVQDPHYSAVQVSYRDTKPAQSAFDSYFDDDNTVGCSVM